MTRGRRRRDRREPPGATDPEHTLGFTPQPMVRWLGPRGLSATAMQVLLSTIFGAYSDKRDMQAALKPPAECDLSGADTLWFDFLADTGDGFNPTYTTAALIAGDELVLDHDGQAVVTERGPLLLLGGDLAYPAATPTQFRERFLGPFTLAFPPSAAGDDPPTVIACAGNHDWYDGLTTFLRLFCEGKRIGGWRTAQTRSYFAMKLPQRWWILGIDLAFDFFIDAPQMDFFRTVATEQLQPGDRVILVNHRPSWLFAGLGEHKLYTHQSTANLQEFERTILHDNGIEVPLVLAGDIHHYNRYVSDEGDQQRITAGAGGTFLHPTDYLRTEFTWPTASGTTTFRQEALYPDVARSKRLRWGTLLAPFKNPSFVAFLGAFYLLFTLAVRFALPNASTVGLNTALKASDPDAVAQAVFNNPISFLLAIGLLAMLITFADASTMTRRVLAGGAHWLFQFLLLVLVIWGMAQLAVDMPEERLTVEGFFVKFTLTLDTLVLIVGVAVVGGYLASQLFAVYLFAGVQPVPAPRHARLLVPAHRGLPVLPADPHRRRRIAHHLPHRRPQGATAMAVRPRRRPAPRRAARPRHRRPTSSRRRSASAARAEAAPPRRRLAPLRRESGSGWWVSVIGGLRDAQRGSGWGNGTELVPIGDQTPFGIDRARGRAYFAPSVAQGR